MRNVVGRRLISAVVLGSLLAVLGVVSAPAASAQIDRERIETCGHLNVLGIPEGPFAVEAVEALRGEGPNPPGIEAALDILLDFADGEGDEPALDEVDAAYETLQDYYGGTCVESDRCALVRLVLGSDQTASADAANLLRRIETPSPPGIDAALALIAGDIDESPFHESVAEAIAQIDGYYPCELAFTGSTTELLTGVSLAMMSVGGACVVVRRRSDNR